MADLIACPDCGAEVRKVETQTGVALAERAEDGPWLISRVERWEDPSQPPLALRATNRQSARWAEDGGWRYRRHPCSRRVEVRDNLRTLRRIYGERKGSPSISVPMSRIEGTVEPGNVLTLHNPRGGSVRAEVKRVEAVVVPRWETYEEPSDDSHSSSLNSQEVSRA